MSLSTHLDVLMFCWLVKLVLKIAAQLMGQKVRLTFCFWRMKSEKCFLCHRRWIACHVSPSHMLFLTKKKTENPREKNFTHHFAGAVLVLCFNCIRWCWCRWHVTRWHLYFSFSLRCFRNILWVWIGLFCRLCTQILRSIRALCTFTWKRNSYVP